MPPKYGYDLKHLHDSQSRIMTTDEQHTEIGRMYVEREEVRRKLRCLDNKAR